MRTSAIKGKSHMHKNIIIPAVAGVAAGLAKLAVQTAGFNAVGVVGKGIGFGFKAAPVAMVVAAAAVYTGYGLYKLSQN